MGLMDSIKGMFGMGTSTMERATDSAKDTAGDIADQAKDVADATAEQAGDMAEGVTDKAKSMTGGDPGSDAGTGAAE